MELRDRIKSARKALGISQEVLARRADVSLSLVNQIERGVVVDPHYSTLNKIADGLGIGVGELLGDKLQARLVPRVARLEGLELGELRDRQRAAEERLSELKREVPFGQGVKEEITDHTEYYDLVDEIFAIRTVLVRTATKQLSPGE